MSSTSLHFALIRAFVWAFSSTGVGRVCSKGNCAADCWRRDSSAAAATPSSSSFDRRPLCCRKQNQPFPPLLQPPPPMPCSSIGNPRPTCLATGQSLITSHRCQLVSGSFGNLSAAAAAAAAEGDEMPIFYFRDEIEILFPSVSWQCCLVCIACYKCASPS